MDQSHSQVVQTLEEAMVPSMALRQSVMMQETVHKTGTGTTMPKSREKMMEVTTMNQTETMTKRIIPRQNHGPGEVILKVHLKNRQLLLLEMVPHRMQRNPQRQQLL